VAAAEVTWSVSTWRQPIPPSTGVQATVVAQLAGLVVARSPGRLRIAVDGLTAAGKTSFGHALAVAVAAQGRPAFRASLDDFKRPWADRHLYDRESGEGYFRNAWDHEAVWRLLLGPAAPSGDGRAALCSMDALAQVDRSSVVASIPPDGVLIVDGVFAFRPELDEAWDLRIWLDVDPELSVRRGGARDGDREGGVDVAEVLHRERYLAAERIYLAEADPIVRADVVIDTTDLATPVVRRWPDGV
jgi:uridine kinase